MGIYHTKSKWQNALRPAVALSVSLRLNPDLFTYAALALAAVAAVALYRGQWLGWVPVCVSVRLLLNLIDGQVARALGLADSWGETKNEFSDRLADAAIFIGLGLGGYADARLALLALALILMVSYLGVLGKAVGGARVYGGLFGKGDRMLSLALFTLYPLFSGDLAAFNWYLALAAVAAALTLVQRLRIIYAQTHSGK